MLSSDLKSIAYGILLTSAVALIPWNYCSGGDGYGLPIAMVRPSHEESFGAILFETTGKTHGTELSTTAVGVNLLFWSLVVLGVILLYRRIVGGRVAA